MKWIIAIMGVLWSAAASAQMPTLPLAAAPVAGGGCSGYSGPIDVYGTGVIDYWGLRAASCAVAQASASAIILCTPADAACETETLNASGNLTLGAVGATCNITSIICTIKEFFGQKNGIAAIQTTIADRFNFNPSCVNSLPCGESNPGRIYIATIPSTGQPFMVSAVVSDQGSSQYDRLIGTPYVTGPGSIYWDTGTNVIGFDSTGTFFDVTATPGTGSWFAAIGLFNGSSSIANVNGSTGAGSPGTGTTTTIALGNDPGGGFATTGYFAEFIAWAPTAAPSAGTLSSIVSNQRAYWGF